MQVLFFFAAAYVPLSLFMLWYVFSDHALSNIFPARPPDHGYMVKLPGVPHCRTNSCPTGNLQEIFLPNTPGDQEFAWPERYGPIYRIKGCFGVGEVKMSDLRIFILV